MKKLMIALGAVALATCSYGAAATWGVEDVLIPVAANPKVSQTGIGVQWGVNNPFAADALTINFFYADSDGNWQSITSLANDEEGELTQGQFWSKSEAQAIKAAIGGTTTDFRITATYATADGIYSYEGVLEGVSFKKAADGSGNSPVAFDMADSDQGSWSYTANAVPEPTSGLLLLLGVAGLALRRRRA